jgi:glycerol-3-phosphate O-acyltransferase/dihydroxyacetone phosphate acyltransferase
MTSNCGHRSINTSNKEYNSTLFYTLIRFMVRVLLHIFYRNIQVQGIENVPKDKPVIITGVHCNGLLDAAVISLASPRQVSFVCKSTLFQMPILGFLLKQLRAVPVKRRQDFIDPTGQQREQDNSTAFEGMYQCLNRNGAFAIFPEGVSHNESDFQELKTGFARAAIGALKNNSSLESVYICPMGLNYLNKSAFRSDIFINFNKPIIVTKTQVEQLETPEQERELVHKLRDQLCEYLKQVTLVAPSWNHIYLLSLARTLYMEEKIKDSSELYIKTMKTFIDKWSQL